jgi:5-methylthioadenosine/S-adenosylhomocysteine deaminase
MYFYPGAALEAALAAGMRISLGMIVLDFPSAYAADPDDYLAKGLALRDQWREHPLVTFCLAPHAPYTVSDAAFGKIAGSPRRKCRYIHLHETEDELAVRSRARRARWSACAAPALAPFDRACRTVTERDRPAREHGASAVHCPTSNLKQAVSPWQERRPRASTKDRKMAR